MFIKFNKEKLVSFINKIESMDMGKRYHYALMGECKTKREDTGRFGTWHFMGWSVPDSIDLEEAEECKIKEVRSSDKYRYYIMLSKTYTEYDGYTKDGYVRESQERYELSDEWLEALGIERKELKRH